MRVRFGSSVAWCVSVGVVLFGRPIFPQSKAQQAQMRKDGVQLALPEMISYQRVAQLLDGMFEDAAGIQVKPLTLDATAANSSNLDAIQQSFQIGASYNYLD